VLPAPPILPPPGTALLPPPLPESPTVPPNPDGPRIIMPRVRARISGGGRRGSGFAGAGGASAARGARAI